MDDKSRLERARLSLEGLSVGDAFGERFFGPPLEAARRIEARTLPSSPWGFTDDTTMAISIVDVLAERGEIDCDRLAVLFGARYLLDPRRGYGGTAHDILARIGAGEPWREVASSVFDGQGSMGNGGAMRAPPIGAYFYDDYVKVVDNARRSAEVTHAHPEGQAGAVAAAVAAAWVARGGTSADDLFATVLAHTPEGATRAGIERAAALPASRSVGNAADELGNGSRVIAEDTVPLSIWCTARHLESFEEALWATVSGFGDRDTTCAIVGGILGAGSRAAIPPAWQSAREPLDRMALVSTFR